MKRSKKIFLVLMVAFFLLLAYAGYDISSRTTFPGSRPQLPERLRKSQAPSDSVAADSIEKKIE